MNHRRGFSMILLLVILAVIIIGSGVSVFLYITSNSNPQLGSNAYTPSDMGITIPKPDSDLGFKTASISASPAASPSQTQTPPTPAPAPSSPAIPTGQVETLTSLSSDLKTFTIKFESSSNFRGINSVSYNLTYTADSGQKAVQGTFNIASSTITPDANGKQSIQKDLALGTCSGGTCVYDSNPRGFRLSITAK